MKNFYYAKIHNLKLKLILILLHSCFSIITIAQNTNLTENEIINLAKKIYLKDASNLKSGRIQQRCGTYDLTTLERELQTLNNDSPTKQQVEKIIKSATVNLEKTYELSDFQSEYGSNENFSFTIKYTLADEENAPPSLDSDGDGHPDYVEIIAGTLEYSKRQFERIGFKKVNNNITVCIQDYSAYGATNALSPIYIDNSLTDEYMRITPTHELFHKFQYEYNDGWFDNADWIFEGTATLAEDIIFDNNSDVANWASTKLGDLSTSLIYTEQSRAYEAVLYWKYFTEKYGNPSFKVDIEPYFPNLGISVDLRGADALKALWEEIYSSVVLSLGTYLPQVDNVVRELAGFDFKTSFTNWCIANYAKDVDPTDKYKYIENDRYGKTPILTLGDILEYDTWKYGRDDYVKLDSWAADYFEFTIPDELTKFKINAEALNTSNSPDDNGKIFVYIPGNTNDEIRLFNWTEEGDKLILNQELDVNSGTEKICIGVFTYKNELEYKLEVGSNLNILPHVKNIVYDTNNPATDILIYFNEPIKSSTLNTNTITVQGSISGAVTFGYNYDNENRTLRIDPNTNFFSGENVTITLSSEIEDLTGNLFDGNDNGIPGPDYECSFVLGGSQTNLKSDSLALVALYNTCGGPNWDIKTNWLTGSVKDWYGITVSNNRVIKLDLGTKTTVNGNIITTTYDVGNNLAGRIPIELWNLSALEKLDLSGNDITGEISTKIKNLQNLKDIRIVDTKISGVIPPEIGSLTMLNSLWLDRDELNGELPAEIGNLPNLEYLILSEQNFAGELPNSLSNLNLKRLYIHRNSFHGPIPKINPSALQIFYIAENKFNFSDIANSGILPGQISSFKYCCQAKLSAPQKSVNGDQITLSIEDKHPENSYQWYFNGTTMQNSNNSSIEILKTDKGLYSCRIQNSLYPDLTLQTEALLIEDNSIFEQDSLALVALYNACNGNDWKNNTNWLKTPVKDWYGIETLNNRVKKIRLNGNNLKGHIPNEIGNLTDLENLEIKSNQIEGTIPIELWNLSNLKVLILGSISFWDIHNQITGQISPNIGNLKNLEVLYLGFNKFSGSLPEEIWNLNKLRILDIQGNQFEGNISGNIGNLRQLISLNLGINNFSGLIPNEIGYLSELESLILGDNFNFHHNQFTGEIPIEIGNLSKLTILNLDYNKLNGLIPEQIWDLRNLVQLRLQGNEITGVISNSIANLSNLELLWLGKNELTGVIPSEIGELKKLTNLGLLENQLSGELPLSIYNLTNLQSLNLSNNRLSGSILNEIGNLTKLTGLYLHFNHFSGELPNTITKLNLLARISLANNDFTALPTLNKSNLPNLLTVDMSINRLDFSSIENNSNLRLLNEDDSDQTWFNYCCQKKIGEEKTIEVTENEELQIGVECGGNNNLYQWFKDGVPLSEPQNSNNYVITNFSVNDQGNYMCQVTNSVISDLSLQSYPIILKIISDAANLNSIAISGTNSVNENSSASYSCTANYSDGSKQDVTSSTSWSVNPTTYATIGSSTGVLTTSSVSSDQSCTITANYGGKSDIHNITIKNIVNTNHPPNKPVIVSPENGAVFKVGDEHTYEAYGTDDDGDNLDFYFYLTYNSGDWGLFNGSTSYITPVTTFTAAGTFQIKVQTVDPFGAKSEFSEVTEFSVEWPTSTNYLKFGKDITFYPNPANKKVIVNMKQLDYSNFWIKIYSIQGTLLLKKKVEAGITELNVQNFKTGVYLLSVETNNNIGIEKLIIE